MECEQQLALFGPAEQWANVAACCISCPVRLLLLPFRLCLPFSPSPPRSSASVSCSPLSMPASRDRKIIAAVSDSRWRPRRHRLAHPTAGLAFSVCPAPAACRPALHPGGPAVQQQHCGPPASPAAQPPRFGAGWADQARARHRAQLRGCSPFPSPNASPSPAAASLLASRAAAQHTSLRLLLLGQRCWPCCSSRPLSTLSWHPHGSPGTTPHHTKTRPAVGAEHPCTPPPLGGPSSIDG